MVKRGKSNGRTELDVDEIATLLKVRKDDGHSTVLLLGSRAGAFFQSEQFYETLQQWSERGFTHLTPLERFQECYTVLTADRYGEADIYHMLRTSINKSAPTKADVCLADLIKQGYFKEIISTNIDDALEQAFIKAEMREGYDFEIHDPSKEEPNEARTGLCRVTKAFGDMKTREYSIGGRLSYLDSNQEFKEFLGRLLKRETLVIGFDMVWDQDITRVIFPKGKALWFVNEENLSENPLLSNLWRARQIRSIAGLEGGYEQFITKLYRCLTGTPVPMNYYLGSSILEQLQRLQEGQRLLQEEHIEILNEIKQLRRQIETNVSQPDS